MHVTTVTHEPVVPVTTYDVTFSGLTRSELLYLRASLSDCPFYRDQAREYAMKYNLHVKLDTSIPSLFQEMLKEYNKSTAA